MHDYGFWYGDDKGYLEPLYGIIHGQRVKGSELLWKMCRLALANHEGFDPKYLANITVKELGRIFSDNNGPVPWPDFETRFRMTRAYGGWFLDEGINPQNIIEAANKTEEPLHYFLTWMRIIPGYNRDLLEKRNLLLAMALANRPEKFLNVKDPQNWRPIVDYHLMRVALRLGLVDLFEQRSAKIITRKGRWVISGTEREIRYAVFNAVSEIINQSGRPMSFIDEKMWMGRKYCPEMEPPNCIKCIFNGVCKKRIELFQPVFRTTSY